MSESNLEGKGYLGFREPLDDKSFLHSLTLAKQACQDSLKSIDEVRSFAQRGLSNPWGEVNSGLSGFLTVVEILEDFKHPKDLERVLSDAEFFRNYKLLVEHIESSDILGAVKHRSDEDSSEVRKKISDGIDLIRGALLRSHIYLDGQIEKDEK